MEREHELDILPVKHDPDAPIFRDVHENLPQPPFRIAVIGTSSSGKSNYIMNYFRPSFYGGDKKKKIEPVFDRIVVISPNFGLDSTTRHISELCEESDIHMTYSDSIIQNLIEGQKALGKHKQKILLIADDLIALGAPPTALIFTSSSYLRHLCVSIVYISQTYRGVYSLPPVVRNNLCGLVFFKNPSQHQVKGLCEDLAGAFGTPKNVLNLLDYATKEPYSFAYFDYKKSKVYKKHTEFLWSKFNEDGSYSDDWKVPSGHKSQLDDIKI